MMKENNASSSDKIRIMVVEDHMLTRLGLIHSLKKHVRIEVVAEAQNGQEAVILAERLQPDLMLMDLAMPVLDGITATQHIKSAFPGIRILILTSYKSKKEALAALTAGADGYCIKDIQPERLIQAIEMVAEGVLWLDPAIAGLILEILGRPSQDIDVSISKSKRQADQNPVFPLTEREYEVLTHIVNGKSNKEIAEALHLSIHTIKGHVCAVIQKMAVDDRTQAAVKALKLGLITGLK